MIEPALVSIALGSSPMTVLAVTDFPDPDSPITPTRAPAAAFSGSAPTSPDDAPRDVTRCKLCGRHVAGYDHHCLWIDACVGDDRIPIRIRI